MMLLLAQFLFASVLIVGAGIFLTKAADDIADKTGLGKLIIGSLLLAGATSLTEIFVGINSIRSGIPELALGNLLGACLVNLFILSLADALHRSRQKKFSTISAGHALSASLLIVLVAIVAVGILLTPASGGIILFNGSLPSYLILIVNLISMKIIFNNQNCVHHNKNSFRFPLKQLLPSIIIFSLSAAVIAYACPTLVQAAEELSQRTGMGETFIGLTLISITTSLPEMVATLQAVRMGSYDMAFGNILGSNAYNILVIAILDFFVDGSIFAAIGIIHVFTCLSIILCIAIAVIGNLYQVERKKSLLEPDAILIMSTICLCYYLLYEFSMT